MGASNQKEYYVQGPEFRSGLFTASPRFAIPNGSASFIQNVDFTRSGDCVTKRKGTAVYQAEKLGTGFSAVTGLHQYVQSTGSLFDVASSGNDVWNVSGGVWTSIYTGAMAGAKCEFVTFNDTLIMVSETEATRKWLGVGAMAVLLGTPPANGKYIVVWKNRVWIANTAAGKSRLHYSADGNPEDWTTVGSAGFIDVNLNDGDEITGLKAIGTNLCIFKRNAVYILYGSSPSSYEISQRAVNRGCVSHRSIVNMGEFLIYLGAYGVHSISGTVQATLSPAIRFDIEGMSTTVKSTTASGRLRCLYLLAYDSDSDGKNDYSYCLDTLTGAWSQWDKCRATCYYTKKDDTLIFGGSDKVILRQQDTGEDDEGSAITMRWRSKQFDMGDFSALKLLKNVFTHAKPISGKTLKIRVLMNGVLVEEVSSSLTAHQTTNSSSVLTDETELVIPLWGKETWANNQFFQVEYANDELAAPVEIYQFMGVASLTPFQFPES